MIENGIGFRVRLQTLPDRTEGKHERSHLARDADLYCN